MLRIKDQLRKRCEREVSSEVELVQVAEKDPESEQKSYCLIFLFTAL